MTAVEELHAASDPSLATMAETGDEQAFAELYDRHASAVWGYAIAVTGNPDEAAAVLVETFARVFTTIRAGRFDPDTTFRALALKVARDTATDRAYGREEKPARFEYVKRIESRLIAAAFAPLPERLRSVLWMTEIERMRAVRVAPVIGLAPEATGDLSRRARNGFREQYLRADIAETDDRNCVRAATRLVAHLDGTLGLTDNNKLDRHLRLCDACTTRRRELSDLAPQLRHLIVPLPGHLRDEARAAWSAIVVAPARSGMSPTTEKILAGVTAFAAAAGIIGAAFIGTTTGRSEAEAATPISPSLADTPSQPQLDLGDPVLLDLPRNGAASFRDGTRRVATAGRVVGVSAPAGGATPATDLTSAPVELEPLSPVEPKSSGPVDDGTDDAPAETAPAEPVVTAGVVVADQPVVIEVGEGPGLTVGPVSLGSEPEAPESAVEVSGPLAPASPAAEAVSTVVAPVAGL